MLTGTTTPVVSLFDPAIDIEQTDIEKYKETRDLTLLRAKPGQTLTVFHVRRLSRAVMQRSINRQPVDVRPSMAFQFGVEKVENLKADVGLVPLVLPQQTFKGADEQTKIFSELELDQFQGCDIDDIGGVVYNRAFLPRGSAGLSRLPHSLSDAWEDLCYRRAALSAQSGQSNESPKEPPTPQPAPSGDEHTSATATENHISP